MYIKYYLDIARFVMISISNAIFSTIFRPRNRKTHKYISLETNRIKSNKKRTLDCRSFDIVFERHRRNSSNKA